MKKLYISVDIEGIWGNGAFAHTAKNGTEYEEYRTNMISEVNLLIDKLFTAGAEEVVVNDGHGNMDNLSASRLDPRACMVVSNGAYKEYGMMEGLDDTFDGVCFVGYHCRSNTRGVMAHTIWGTLVRSIRVDGEEMGESGINARLAWEYGVPIVLISGDDLLKEQLKEELPMPFAYVETKRAISSQCALSCSWQMLEERYERAVSSMEAHCGQAPVYAKKPHCVDITFHHERNADFVSRMDGVTRISDCTVRIQKDSYDEVYRYLRFVIKISNAFAA